jgi:hypothetical protein
MKRIGLGTIFALLMSLAVFSYGRQAGQDPGGANQEPPNNHQEVQPPPRAPEMTPPRGDTRGGGKQQPEAKPPKTEKEEQQKPAHEQHGTSAQQRQTRPAGKSAHIPDPQFKANFGKQHRFTVNRVITTTTVVPNQTQFVYAGYTFIFLDPWPADWLFTDDCYVDYVDEEYFLFDVFHPGIRVALFVVG